jgi:hypothetical protein
MRSAPLVVAAALACASCAGARPAPVDAGGRGARGGGGGGAGGSGRAGGGGDYAAPLGCYPDFDALGDGAVLDSEAALAAILRPYPEDANRPPCDPQAATRAIDFTRERIFYQVVQAAGHRIFGAAITCSASGAVTVTVQVGPECGGAENGPGYVLVRVPAVGTISLVDSAPQTCPDYGDGDLPA